MRNFPSASSVKSPTALLSPRRATVPVKLPAHIVSSRQSSPAQVSLRSSLEVLGQGKAVGASSLPLPDSSIDQGGRSCSSCSCPCSPSASLCRSQLSPDVWSAGTPSTCASSACQSMYAKLKEELSSECIAMQVKMKEDISALSQRVDDIARCFGNMEQILGIDVLESGVKKDSLRHQLYQIRNGRDPPASEHEAGEPEVLQQLIDDSVRFGIEAKEIQCAREKLRELEEFPKSSATLSSVTDMDMARLTDICRDAQQWETVDPALDLDQPEDTAVVVCTNDHVLRDITSRSCNAAANSSPGVGAKRIDSGGACTVVFKEPFTFSESGLLDDVSLRASRTEASPFAREGCEALNSASPHRRGPQEVDATDGRVVLDLSDVLDEVHHAGDILGNSLDESMIGAGIDESFDGAPPAIARPQPSPSTIFFPAPPVNVSPLASHAGDSQAAQSSIIIIP